jgi:hypothetical protein
LWRTEVASEVKRTLAGGSFVKGTGHKVGYLLNDSDQQFAYAPNKQTMFSSKYTVHVKTNN